MNRTGKKIEVRRREEREGEREKAKKLQLSKSKNIARTYESKSPSRLFVLSSPFRESREREQQQRY